MEPSFKNHLFYVAFVVLVAIASFGLGRLSKITAKEPVTISYFDGAATSSSLLGSSTIQNISTSSPQETVEITASEALVVASKKGSKYHLLTCSGAKTISDENKIYFKTIAAARAAGYTPAANCKGLQ